MEFTYDVNIASKRYGKGLLDFGVRIEFLKNYDHIKNKNMWEINLKHDSETNIREFGCILRN